MDVVILVYIKIDGRAVVFTGGFSNNQVISNVSYRLVKKMDVLLAWILQQIFMFSETSIGSYDRA